MVETMTNEQAQQVFLNIAKAKRNGTSKSDEELAAEAQKAQDATKVNAAKANAAADDDAKTARAEALAKAIKDGTGGFWEDRDYDFNRAYKHILSKKAGNVEWIKKLQSMNDDVLLASAALELRPSQVVKRIPEFREYFSRELGKASSDLAKAMSAATANVGADWIPEFFSPELFTLVRNERILGSGRVFPIRPMSSPTMHVNQLTAEFVTYTVGESTSNAVFTVPATVSDLGTDRQTLTAKKLITIAIFSYEFEEDSIVDVLPTLRSELIESMAFGREDVIVNASEAAVHPDADVTGILAATMKVRGLRAQAMGNNMADAASAAVDMAAPTVNKFLEMQLKQGRFGKDVENVWITSSQGWVKMVSVQDTAGNQVMITADKLGKPAVITQGSDQVRGEFMGSPVIISDAVKTDLNSAGIRPASPDTKTMVIRANKKYPIIGELKKLKVESDKFIMRQQNVMVATQRLDWLRVKPSRNFTDRPVTVGLNMSVTSI